MRRAMPLIIFLISAAALAFEVQLLRLLSIQHWHQFASMIISLALLGYAGSGVLLTLLGELPAARRVQILLNAGRLLVLSMPACSWLAQQIPFNSLELLWDPKQLLLLGLIFLTLSLPFFLAGLFPGKTDDGRRRSGPGSHPGDLPTHALLPPDV